MSTAPSHVYGPVPGESADGHARLCVQALTHTTSHVRPASPDPPRATGRARDSRASMPSSSSTTSPFFWRRDCGGLLMPGTSASWPDLVLLGAKHGTLMGLNTTASSYEAHWKSSSSWPNRPPRPRARLPWRRSLPARPLQPGLSAGAACKPIRHAGSTVNLSL